MERKYNYDIKNWYDLLIYKSSALQIIRKLAFGSFRKKIEKNLSINQIFRRIAYSGVRTWSRYRAVVSGMIRYFVWRMFLRSPCCEKKAIISMAWQVKSRRSGSRSISVGRIFGLGFGMAISLGPVCGWARSWTELQSCI